MTVSENIKSIRKQKGLTQKQLGDLCNIAESTIRRYELGLLNPKIETIQKIADALEVPISSLITGYFDMKIEAFAQNHPEGTLTDKGLYSDNYINLIKKRLNYIGCPFISDAEGNAWIKFPDGSNMDFSEDELIELMEDADSYLQFKLEELRKKKQK